MIQLHKVFFVGVVGIAEV